MKLNRFDDDEGNGRSFGEDDAAEENQNHDTPDLAERQTRDLARLASAVERTATAAAVVAEFIVEIHETLYQMQERRR